MSYAYKCDSCKTYFDPMEVNGPFARIDCSSSIFIDAESYKNNTFLYTNRTDWHLCPKCAKVFAIWLGAHDDIREKMAKNNKEDK